MKEIFIFFILKLFFIFITFELKCEDLRLGNPLKSFGRKDGLPSNCIYDVFKDRNDYLWFSTNKGVSRFDGHHFSNIDQIGGILDDDVFFSREDRKGRIWMFTSSSKISIFENNVVLNTNNAPFLRKLLNNSWHTSFIEDDFGNIWISSYSDFVFKVDSLNNVTKYRLTSGNYFTSNLIKEASGKICIFSGVGKHEFSDNGFELVYHFDYGIGSLFRVFPLGDRKYIVFDQKGCKIIDYRGSELSFNVINGRYGIVNCFVSIGNDEYYFSDDHGIFHLVLKDLEHIKLSEVYAVDGVSSIYILDQKAFCFTTLDNGVKFSFDDRIKFISNKSYGPNRTVLSLFSTKNILYMGGYYGNLNYVSGKKFGQLLFTKDLLSYGRGRITGFRRSFDSCVAVLYEQRFLILDKLSIKFIFSFGAKAYAEDKKNVYIASSRDVVIVPKDSIKSVSIGYKNDKKLKVYDRFVDFKKYSISPWLRTYDLGLGFSDKLIIASNKGLIKYDISSNLIDTSHFSRNVLFRYPFNIIKSFNNDTKIVFISGYGLGVFDGVDVKLLSLGSIIDNNLVVNSVRFFNHENGNLWLSTNKGLLICKFNEKKLIYNIEQITMNDGLLSDDVFDVIYFNNCWWVATSHGVSVLHRSFFGPKDEPTPKVTFEDLVINGVSRSVGLVSELVEGSTRASFSLGCLSYKHLGNIRFRYKLRPGDYWRYTKEFDHEFSSLSRGDYRIEVQARSPYSAWSASQFLPAFTVLPPFWERPWVQYSLFGMAFFLFAVIAYGAYRVRLDRIRLRNQMIDANLRALRSQIKPHFLSNIIHSVQHYFDNNRREDAVLYLSKFGRVVRRILDTSDQNFIRVPDEIKQIHEYLEFECSKAREKIAFVIDVQEEYSFDHVFMPTMLIQPVLENAIVHGLANGERPNGRIELHIAMVRDVDSEAADEGFRISKEGRLIVTITDNGVGRLATAGSSKRGSSSFGVRSLEERLNWISRKFKTDAFGVVEDLYDDDDNPTGTMVIFNLPLMFKDPLDELEAEGG